MANTLLKFVLPVLSLMISHNVVAAENNRCDFSISQQSPSTQITSLLNQLPDVVKTGNKESVGNFVDSVWNELHASCAKFEDANAVVWRLTQALDETAQYEKAIELNKKAAEATTNVDQHQRFIRKATTQAMLAGKESEAQQFIKTYLSIKNLPAEMWQQDDANNQLNYALAHLTVPLTTGRWTLAKIYSTGQRDGASVIRFTNNGDGIYNVADNYVSADITLHYRGSNDTEHSVKTTQIKRPWLYTTAEDAELSAKLPDFPGENIKQIKSAQRYSVAGDSVTTAIWQITQGSWEMAVQATFQTAHSENALQQLSSLFTKIKWPQADTLPPIQKELDALTKTTYRTTAEWNNAARQANLLLPAAKFPLEKARVNAILGIHSYRQNKLDKAWSYLQYARAAYSQTLTTQTEDNYGSQALLMYLTDIAYRTKKKTYTELVKQSLRHSPMDSHWVFDPVIPQIFNKKSQLRFPFNVGIFHASAFTYIEGTVVYSAAKYGYSTEFSAGLTELSEVNVPNIIKAKIKRLQEEDRQKITIADKDLHKTTYPFSLQGQKKMATKWSVKWYSGSKKTEKSLIYWTFPYQSSYGAILAVVDNKDNAVLPELDKFAKQLAQYSAPASSSVSGERNDVSN
ncbi:hypothetical protein [Citrobacter sedlakii]|uniref:hypothetical protein n=1 Tax=Citrobacter sedlakii TaxID=67826 RepID=UPI00287C6655|nr:hypothetical protein [Citrobacter sedlakii]